MLAMMRMEETVQITTEMMTIKERPIANSDIQPNINTQSSSIQKGNMALLPEYIEHK